MGCTNESVADVLELNAINYPNGLSPLFDPNIDTLSQINRNTIILNFKGSQNPVGYDLNIRENDITYSYTPFLKNVKAGNVKLNLPDSTKSYCFYFSRVSGCGGYEYSSEVCTIKHNTPIVNNNQINLAWNTYPDLINNRPTTNGRHTLEKKYFIEKTKMSGFELFTSNNASTHTRILNCSCRSHNILIKLFVS